MASSSTPASVHLHPEDLEGVAHRVADRGKRGVRKAVGKIGRRAFGASVAGPGPGDDDDVDDDGDGGGGATAAPNNTIASSSTPAPVHQVHLPIEELEGVAHRVADRGKRGVRKAVGKIRAFGASVSGSGDDDDDGDGGGAAVAGSSKLNAPTESPRGVPNSRSCASPPDADAESNRVAGAESSRDVSKNNTVKGRSNDGINPSLGSASSASATSLPAIGEHDRKEGQRPEVSERAKSEPQPPAEKHLPQKPSVRLAAAPKTSGANDNRNGTLGKSLAEHNNGNGMSGVQLMLVLYAALYSVRHVWTRRSAILADQCPLSVVFVLVVGAFLLGYNAGRPSSPEGGEGARGRGSFLGERIRTSLGQRGGIARAADAQEGEEEEEEEEEDSTGNKVKGHGLSRTRSLARRGKRRLKRFGRKASCRTPDVQAATWSDLRRPKEEAKEWERKLKAPFAEGPLMDHLLGYSDFRRRLISRKKIVIAEGSVKAEAPGGEQRGSSVGKEGEAEGEDEKKDISLGNAKMKNTRAESLEGDEQFSHKVDPLCELRGMDMFLTDDPEEVIWRQPLLIQSGLRDMPTFIANMMFPFGNITAYFKLPDWFDDWDNIPEEKDDDPPDIKALKRFLAGDEAYRNARCKVVPHVVDGPLAIRLIKPKPMEVTVDGPRHPARWHQEPKCETSGKAAILECDIDVGLSNNKVRKILNVIRPHIESVTVDVALIVNTPKLQEEEEPSACLGLWRIEKVDFESAAVFPELPVEDACETVKMIMSGMDMEDVEVAA